MDRLKKQNLKLLEIYVAIIPNHSIFQIFRSDIENINYLETSGIYRINFVNNEGNKYSYIGKT